VAVALEESRGGVEGQLIRFDDAHGQFHFQTFLCDSGRRMLGVRSNWVILYGRPNSSARRLHDDDSSTCSDATDQDP
jgi:hypothetical protein